MSEEKSGEAVSIRRMMDVDARLEDKALPHTSARLVAKLAYHRRHKGKGRDEQDGTERG